MVRILVVEDSRTQAQELQLILESQGFTVETAPNGHKGLECLQAERFDLVLSDILMPGLSGYELCRHIKATPETKEVPVILVTKLTDPMDVLQGLECGADNFITKPYEASYLLGRIGNILANKRLRAERRLKVGVEFCLMGKSVTITSDKEQILDLLLSTFEEFMRTKEREHETRLAQETAQRSQRFLQSALDALSAHIAILDASGTIIAVNTAWRRFAQSHHLVTTDCGVGTNYLALCQSTSGPGAEEARAVAQGIREVMAKQRDQFYLEYPCHSGPNQRWFMVRVTRFEGAQPVQVAVAHEDITELKRAEERIREQAALLDKATDAITVRDLQNRILFWNHSAERLYGWTRTEAIGRNANALLFRSPAPELEEACRTVVEEGEWSGELRQVTKDGKDLVVASRWTLVRDRQGRPEAKLVVNTDITEKKKLEAQFLRSQRMDSLGTLAGGIAHDLNNVLTPIMMGVQLLQLGSPAAENQSILAELERSAERGAELVKQILLFAKGIEAERVPLQLRTVFQDIEKMLKRTLPKAIDIQTHVSGDLHLIAGDGTQLYQVLLNLCVNARDAMPRGGQLTIAAANTVLGENYARRHLDPKPGPYVLLTVSDTGTGIPAEVRDKIFDPFYTTKDPGKGTGLGLSTVLSIVKSHGGFIDVFSELGRGTQFSVYLPALETAQSKPVKATGVDDSSVGNGELILVVDDEAVIRQIAKETLQAHGYRVLTAQEGTEAVALFAQHRREVQVVLTDMMMPGMDGPALIRALQELDPDVRIITTSGLRTSGKATEAGGAGAHAFLPKPYPGHELLKTLREVLRAAEPELSGVSP